MRYLSLDSVGHLLLRSLCLAIVGIFSHTTSSEAEVSGAKIYRAKCARCHGANGEGTKRYKKLLAGALSVSQLAEQIAETMPEQDPGSLSAPEARAVAAYIHETFYSAIARARNRPARIELPRLTVRQHRQALTDLIGSFRKAPFAWGQQRGLRGEYYSGRRLGGRRGRAASRIDAAIDFQFGTEAPVSEISEPHAFSIRWTGSFLAPETGEYEFVVRTDHAARLWINDVRRPLVDAWVKSGDDQQYQADLFLVEGRTYPLRLEFTKAKQGVDDSKKRKKKPVSREASVSLLWQRPHGVIEPIPARFLTPEVGPEIYICGTPFPPDDRSYGWERATSVSKSWDQATTSAAIDAAGYVAARVNELAETRPDASDYEEKLRDFSRKFAERAFRRPLSDELTAMYVDKPFAVATNAETAVKTVVLMVLKSPRFLFREVGGGPDHYEVASRLSFGLWDSIPDLGLLEAASEGQLGLREQVTRQAERMLDDLRSKSKLRNFLLTWLKVDAAVDLSKDSERFGEFDNELIADLRTSLELFLDDVVWSGNSDFRQLLLAKDVFLNKRLAAFYGVEADSTDGFSKMKLDDGNRAGVLTHPYIMARFAHSRESSPIYRGVFLARGLLGQSLRPPPVAVAPLAPELHPDLTTRERVSMQTKAATCMACHRIINPLGFTLEHFDAVGRYRESDRGRPVDASGSYLTRDGKTVSLSDAVELARFLADSEEANEAFTEQLFHHLVQQPMQAYGVTTRENLKRTFAAQEFNIRKLAVSIMATSAMIGRNQKVTEISGVSN